MTPGTLNLSKFSQKLFDFVHLNKKQNGKLQITLDYRNAWKSTIVMLLVTLQQILTQWANKANTRKILAL